MATLRAAAVAGSLLMVLSIGSALLTTGRTPDLAEVLNTGLRSLLLYLAVVFVLEEVTFRGAIDAHAHDQLVERSSCWCPRRDGGRMPV